jgi:ATP-dependent Clp protease ATP-binding subunit ClpB
MERLSDYKRKQQQHQENARKARKRTRAILKKTNGPLDAQWQSEKDIISKIQTLKEEIDRVNVEIQQAERDYDLNKAAELKYGTLTDLHRQLEIAEIS